MNNLHVSVESLWDIYEAHTPEYLRSKDPSVRSAFFAGAAEMATLLIPHIRGLLRQQVDTAYGEKTNG